MLTHVTFSWDFGLFFRAYQIIIFLITELSYNNIIKFICILQKEFFMTEYDYNEADTSYDFVLLKIDVISSSKGDNS